MAAATGVELGAEKSYVVQSRLSILARTLGFGHVRDLMSEVVTGKTPGLQERVVDALLNKETFFFRHPETFEALRRHILPQIQASPGRSGPIRIWSAACSTGQEVYSIAMMLADAGLCQRDGDVEIMATDYSLSAIEQAMQGSYSQLEVSRGLPAPCLLRFFRQEGHRWLVAPWLRRNIRFVRSDLFSGMVLPGFFDVVFCRNVAIYFSDAGKERLYARVARSMTPGGYLLVGGTECASRHSSTLFQEQWKNVVYYRTKVGQ
jgi:chemotaxis protein methyltransferase CheR